MLGYAPVNYEVASTSAADFGQCPLGMRSRRAKREAHLHRPNAGNIETILVGEGNKHFVAGAKDR